MSNTGPEGTVPPAASGGGGAGLRPAGADVGAGRAFEEAERELAEIVERLERGEVQLDEAIALWERGEELYRVCREKLDAAQGKVEELARRIGEAKPGAGA